MIPVYTLPLWTLVYLAACSLTLVTSMPVPVHENAAVYYDQQQRDMCDPCPPGTYMEEPCLPDNTDNVTCRHCPDGTYMGQSNHASFCHPHKSICDAPYQRRKPVQPGTKTQDSLCHCKHGAVRINNNKCVKMCPPGKGVTKDLQCKRCKQGTFSDKRSYIQECLPIRNCAREGRETILEGSRTSDAICGDPLTQQSVIEAPEGYIAAIISALQKKAEQLAKMYFETTKMIDGLLAIAADVGVVTDPASITDSDNLLMATNLSDSLIIRGNTTVPNREVFVKFSKPKSRTVTVTRTYKSWRQSEDRHFDQGVALADVLEATSSPGQPGGNTTLIVIAVIATLSFVGTLVLIGIGVITLRCLNIMMKKNFGDAPTTHRRGDIGPDAAHDEELEEPMPPLSQEQSSPEHPSPHADLQEPSPGAEGVTDMDKEDISSGKEVEIQPSSVPAAVVRPKQRSLTSQPTVPSSEDSFRYRGSLDEEETVPLLLRDSQEISSPKEPIFKAGLEVALHPTPEDAGSLSSIKEDTAEPSVPQPTLPTEAAKVQEDEEEQPTVDSEHVEDVPRDAGLPSEPEEVITEKDEDETDLKEVSGDREDTENIPPDIEEIARTAMVRVPSDELSFPVQETSHDTDGLEALGAVGGRSESYSPLPSTDADSDQSSGDEAYERKVRLAIRDSVAKSLFTGLAHHLSNPAGPGPDWVPLARAAGISGPEIDHIINQAAQELDKDIRKMLERYEEGKTGDRPISELYGELIARKRQQLYDTFRRDRPS